DRSPALLDRRDDLNHISLADLMDAPAGPGSANLPAKELSDLAPGAILRQALLYEGLQQILDSVRHDTSPRRSLLACRIAALQLRRKHFLRHDARLMKSHAPVWPDRVLAQPRSGTACSVKNDEHLAAIRRHLNAEAGTSSVPVDYVRLQSRQRVDRALGQSDAWHGKESPVEWCYLDVA